MALSWKQLILIGIGGLVAFALIPTLQRAVGVDDSGGLATVIWLIQIVAGFGGVIALVAGVRARRAERRAT